MTLQNKMTRRHALLKGLSASGLVLFGPAGIAQSALAADGVNIVNTSGTSGMTLQALMRQKGYMTKMGVNANIVNVADASRLMGSLISGESDLSTSAGFAQVLPAIEKGGKLKIIAGAQIVPVHAVYSKKPEIKSVKDLVGRTVGTGAPGSLLHTLMVAVLRKYGVDETKVNFVNVGSNLDVFRAVAAGAVDAGPSEVDFYYKQAEYGVHSLVDGELWKELPNFTFQAAYASDKAIETKRDAIVKTLAAFALLYRFADSPDSLDDFAKARAEATGKDERSEAETQWRFNRDNHSYSRDLILSDERINYMQELNKSLGVQKQILPISQVADMSLARDALKLIG
jgi:ABC-type nitrate/sulfonate/bicarbonate transport system substrate-binding protein